MRPVNREAIEGWTDIVADQALTYMLHAQAGEDAPELGDFLSRLDHERLLSYAAVATIMVGAAMAPRPPREADTPDGIEIVRCWCVPPNRGFLFSPDFPLSVNQRLCTWPDCINGHRPDPDPPTEETL